MLFFLSQVAMIGISSFACAALHLLSQNVEADDQFDPCIKVWVQDPLDEFEVSKWCTEETGVVIVYVEADDQFDPCIMVWVQDPLDKFEVSRCCRL